MIKMNKFSPQLIDSQIYDVINNLHKEDKELYKILIDDLIIWKNLSGFMLASVGTLPQTRFNEITDKIKRKVEEINAKHDAYRLSKERN